MRPLPRPNPDFVLLQRLQKVKQSGAPRPTGLGEEMVHFFKGLEKRQHKFGKIGQAWEQLVPATFNEHCCLETFARGTLTVLVDSSSHLYELKQLLLAGLEKQLLLACKSGGLRKIILKAGKWANYETPQPRQAE